MRVYDEISPELFLYLYLNPEQGDDSFSYYGNKDNCYLLYYHPANGNIQFELREDVMFWRAKSKGVDEIIEGDFDELYGKQSKENIDDLLSNKRVTDAIEGFTEDPNTWVCKLDDPIEVEEYNRYEVITDYLSLLTYRPYRETGSIQYLLPPYTFTPEFTPPVMTSQMKEVEPNQFVSKYESNNGLIDGNAFDPDVDLFADILNDDTPLVLPLMDDSKIVATSVTLSVYYYGSDLIIDVPDFVLGKQIIAYDFPVNINMDRYDEIMKAMIPEDDILDNMKLHEYYELAVTMCLKTKLVDWYLKEEYYRIEYNGILMYVYINENPVKPGFSSNILFNCDSKTYITGFMASGIGLNNYSADDLLYFSIKILQNAYKNGDFEHCPEEPSFKMYMPK